MSGIKTELYGFFWTIANDSPNMIFINQNGRIRYVNKRCIELMGYSKEEFLSKEFDFMSIIAPEDRKRVMNNYKLKVEGGKSKGYEYGIITKDGKRIDCIIDSKIIDFEGGKALLGIVTDISERKTAETELKISQEKLRNLFYFMNDAVIVHDLNGKIIDINKKASVLFGYDKDELLGMNILELHPKSSFDASRFAFEKIIKNGHVRFVIDFKTKRGSIMTCNVSSSLVNIGGTDIVQEIVRDITNELESKKIIEQKLVIEKIISKISSRFIRVDKFDENVDRSLKEMGEISGASRSYLFLINGRSLSNTNEWCADGVSPEIDNLQNLRVSEYHWWFDNLKKGIIHIPDVSKMPKEASNEKAILQSQKIKTLMVLPIMIKDNIKGFVGFDNVRSLGEWDDTNLNMLKVASEIMSSALERNLQEEDNLRLQETLRRYAKKLEIKVKKFEKNLINLTQKEKKVMVGMSLNPDMNDRELSSQIGLNRSTITAIRNRLRKQEIYRFINVPNLKLFGKEMLTVIYGKFDKEFRYSGRYKETFNDPRFIYTLISDDHFLTIVIVENLVEFHKIVDPLLILGSKYNFYKESPTVVHFPFEISRFMKILDFTDVVNDVLDQGITKKSRDLEEVGDVRLTKNIRSVLKGLIRYPEITTVELAKRLGLTRATVTSKLKLLNDNNMVRKILVPDLSKLNCKLLVICHIQYKPRDSDERRKLFNDEMSKYDVLNIENGTEGIILKVFASNEDMDLHMKALVNFLKENDLISKEPIVVPIALNQIKFRNIDFSRFTIHALNP